MIEVKQGVFWDNDSNRQTEEAIQWLHQEILPSLATARTQKDMVQPVYDQYNRPVEWFVDTEMCKVHIEREYVNPNSSSWAMKKDIITVSTKN